MSDSKCIVCGSTGSVSSNSKYTSLNCPRCGNFKFEYDKVKRDIENLNNSLKSSLSNKIRKAYKLNEILEINEGFLKNLQPIKPNEQANNLILYLGDNQKSVADSIYLKTDKLKAYSIIGISIGDKEESNADYIIKGAIEDGLIKQNPSTEPIFLTFKGWQKYDELSVSRSDSKIGFMAMAFKDFDKENPGPLKTVFEFFRKEVKKTGFRLDNPLLNLPQAGSIDSRIAVEIRKARFVVADLSDDNSGAYWEAGFAHGLGKPVFYTFRQDKEKEVRRHFDINHHTTIFWEVGKEQEAAEKLKDVIRNTLPSEAILKDKKEN